MMAQAEPFLEFDEDYVLDQYHQTEAYYKRTGQKHRPWGFGKIYRSMCVPLFPYLYGFPES